MLTEAILGPMWAWLFINELPSIIVMIGGSIVLLAVLIQFFTAIKRNEEYKKT